MQTIVEFLIKSNIKTSVLDKKLDFDLASNAINDKYDLLYVLGWMCGFINPKSKVEWTGFAKIYNYIVENGNNGYKYEDLPFKKLKYKTEHDLIKNILHYTKYNIFEIENEKVYAVPISKWTPCETPQ